MAHLTVPHRVFLYGGSAKEYLMSNAVILTDITGGIGTITLNKPWKLNAWDTPMRAEITALLREWNRDPAVCAVIMTGEGANWFQSWQDFYNAIRGLDKPCLAALNGVAAGSAFQAVMLTDARIGHPGVRMGQPEIDAGIPSVTGPMLMLPRIGLARTMELTLTGRMMEADEARLIGLINYLVPRPEDVMPKARQVAELMASKPVMAFRLNKQRFRQVTQEAFDEAFRNGGAIQAEAYASGEPQETMRRFFAERAARRAARAKA
jgi:enoyl-CoA hydratase/carnithine racemase